VPFTDGNRGLLGAAELALLKPTAFLVVISRGGIVQEDALLAVLKERRIAGAALDVFAQEPLPPESELWGLDNLIITPHTSGASRQTSDGVYRIIQENVARYLAGQPLLNLVDKRRGY